MRSFDPVIERCEQKYVGGSDAEIYIGEPDDLKDRFNVTSINDLFVKLARPGAS